MEGAGTRQLPRSNLDQALREVVEGFLGRPIWDPSVQIEQGLAVVVGWLVGTKTEERWRLGMGQPSYILGLGAINIYIVGLEIGSLDPPI